MESINGGATSYEYNGAGERVEKTTGATKTLFVYGLNGEILGEYDGSGTPIQETIWLDGRPVATKQGNTVYYVHSDHLGTPRVVTNGNTVIWRWDSDPFGATAADEDPDGNSTLFTYNVRFPGQYYDTETGQHYNYYRTFDPSTGKYLESDPIGLDGGLNTYDYVGGNPLSFVDPFGLNAEQIKAMLRLAVRSQADLNVPSKIGVGKFPADKSAITNPITRNITLDNFYLDNDLDCLELKLLLELIIHESIHRTRPRWDSIRRPSTHDDIYKEASDRVKNNKFLQDELSMRCECTK